MLERSASPLVLKHLTDSRDGLRADARHLLERNGVRLEDRFGRAEMLEQLDRGAWPNTRQAFDEELRRHWLGHVGRWRTSGMCLACATP